MRFPSLSSDLMTSVGFWATIAGTLLGALSIYLAIVLGKKGERVKKLSYFVTSPIPIASVVSARAGYKVSLLIEKEGFETIKAEEAHLFFIKLGNLGKEPIREEDLVAADMLRLEVTDALVLDAEVIKVSRSVIGLCGLSSKKEGQLWFAPLSFKFLDYRDGVLIRLLTNSPNARIYLRGTIVGMPKGIEITLSDSDREIGSFFADFIMKIVILLPCAFIYMAAISSIFSRIEHQEWWQGMLAGIGFFLFQGITFWSTERIISSRKSNIWPDELTIPYLPKPTSEEHW